MSQPAEPIQPLRFLGEPYIDRKALAAAVTRSWDRASELVGQEATYHWLRQFPDDPGESGRAEPDDLVARLRAGGASSVDAKLIHLLNWLDPEISATYRGWELAPGHLHELATSAYEHGDPELTLVDGLWRERLLPEYADFPDGAELKRIHDRWSELHASFRRLRATADIPPAVRTLIYQMPLHAALLQIATDHGEFVDHLSRLNEAGRASLPGPVPWFERLAADDPDDPVRLLMLCEVLPLASEEAAQNSRVRPAPPNLRTKGGRRPLRGFGVLRRLLWLVLSVGILFVGWSWLDELLAGMRIGAHSVDRGSMYATFIAAWSIQALAEAGLCVRLGPDYGKGWWLFCGVPRWLRSALDFTDVMSSGFGCGCCCLTVLVGLSAAGLASLLLVAGRLTSVLALTGVLLHVYWTVDRWQHWRRARQYRAP